MLLNKRRLIAIIIFIFMAFLSLFVGTHRFTIFDLLSGDEAAMITFLDSRIPKTFSIIITASALSISGLIMQTINKNNYISPSTIGTTNGARLGILFGFVMFGTTSFFSNFIFSLIFAFLSSLLFIRLIRNVKQKDGMLIPLIGILYSSILVSIGTIIAFNTRNEQFFSALSIGSFTNILAFNHFYIYVAIPVIALSYTFAYKFSLIGVGKDFAKNLGVDYNAVMNIGLLITAFLTAITYTVVGPIPLIGLVIPNIVRLYYGDNLNKSIFDIALFGSSFLLLADVISRVVVYPFVLPVSLIVSVLGSIIFLYLLLRRNSNA